MNFDIALPGWLVGVILVGMVALIVGMIFYLRDVYHSKRTKQAMDGAFKEEASASRAAALQNRTKYEQLNVFSLSNTFFTFGLALAAGLSLCALAWEQYEDKIDIPDGALELDMLEVELPPRTAPPP
ncbi:MAG: energy transducer TonB, partial [Bacteroidota bacterium]